MEDRYPVRSRSRADGWVGRLGESAGWWGGKLEIWQLGEGAFGYLVFHPGLVGSEVPGRPDVRVRGFGEVWSWGSWLMRGRSFVVKTRQEPVSRHNLPLFLHFIFLSEGWTNSEPEWQKDISLPQESIHHRSSGIGPISHPNRTPTARRWPIATSRFTLPQLVLTSLKCRDFRPRNLQWQAQKKHTA